MKYKKYVVIASLTFFLIYACGKDYLQKEALGQVYETTLANKRGVEKLLIGAYSLLDGVGSHVDDRAQWTSAASNWVYGSICGSEAYKGSEFGDQGPEIIPIEKFSPTADNIYLAGKWGTVYDGVQRANDVLRIMAKATDIEPADQKRIAAEARFLRAHYHFEAKKMWNKVPFIDESITYENNNYHVSNEKDIWPDIEKDLRFAIDNLQTTPYGGAVGRATKYTAMALLAKAYMFQKKFSSAKPLLDTIINSGRFQLELVNYADNFNPGTRNGKESIFSVQMSVNDGSNGLNGNFGDVLNFPFAGGPGTCCGFFCPSQYLVNHFKTDPNSGLPDLDNFNDNPIPSDQGIPTYAPFTPYTGTLDPRLDWTVGRRGIPYLDWGLYPGGHFSDGGWIRDTLYDGPYAPKKNVYSHSQKASMTDAVYWTSGTTMNNVNLIRYADVLLWAAEVEVETGNLVKAEDYVNKIRSRMADHHEYWVHKYLDDNNPAAGFYTDDAHLAANYFIKTYPAGYFTSHGPDFARKAIRYERMLELGMEGHRFFDLVRWGIASTEINAYLQKEKTLRPYLNDALFEKCDEYFPIPQVQIDLSAGADGKPKMVQNCR
jgi:hypothetical protein